MNDSILICGVVGLRPSPFNVPSGPRKNPFEDLAIQGPMARNVRDVAFFLDILSRQERLSPFSREQKKNNYLDHALKPAKNIRIAISPDLGLGDVDPIILQTINAAMSKLALAGCEIEDAKLDFKYLDQAYLTLRALDYLSGLGEINNANRGKLKSEIILNIERGEALTGKEVAKAMNARARGYAELMQVFETADVIICPAMSVLPFDVNERYYGETSGAGDENYLDWLAITYVLSPLAVPILSIPCGMTQEGLPIGIQIVGKPQGDAELLSIGAKLEDIIGNWQTQPQQLEEVLNHSTQPAKVV